MNDPIAYLMTIATYGTWLPGDQRGWVEYRHGWQLPDPVLELESRARMTEGSCTLNRTERHIVEKQIIETCRHRGWTLCAANCRTNHLHAVIGCHDALPKKVRIDIKAWCTRRLKELSDSNRDNWWAERGSIRWIFDEQRLQTVIQYVNEGQDRKVRDLK